MTKPHSRNWFGRLGAVLSSLVLLAALAGLAAPYLAARWIELDVFSNLRLHLIAIAAIALIAAFCRRLWPMVLIAGFIATPIAVAVQPSIAWRSDGPKQTVDGEVPLKVLTYNTWFRNDDWETLEAYLRKEDADIVVMMEFGPSKRPLLARLKSMYPHQTDCVSIPLCYLVLLSKKPFESAGNKTRWAGPVIVWARFGSSLGGLTVIGTHLSRPPYAASQLRQVKELAGEARKQGEPVVVVGDFNATGWSHILNVFETASGLARLTSAPTWPTYFLGLPQVGIDHIFISGGIRALADPKRGDDAGSDHLPVSVDLAVQAK